jgi:hypothetical protein
MQRSLLKLVSGIKGILLGLVPSTLQTDFDSDHFPPAPLPSADSGGGIADI